MSRRGRKRASISKDEALRRIEEIMPLLDDNVRMALSFEAALEAANDAVGNLGTRKAYGANTYNTVRDAIAHSLALTLARLYDIGLSRPKNRQDKASIPLLIHLLRQRRCQKALKALARQWTPDFADMQEKACTQALEGAIEAYASLRRNHAGRSAIRRLRELRDKRLAHSLRKEIEALPRYVDLFLLVDTAREVLQHARLAVQGSASDLNMTEKELRREADAFWQPALTAAFHATAGPEKHTASSRPAD